MMDQKGCTEFGSFKHNREEKIREYYNAGARYLIINDPGYLSKPFLGGFLDNKIGEYKNVQIFKLYSP